MFRKRPKRPSIDALDHVALAEILRHFEDEYSEAMGRRITSAQFYDLYRDGAADDYPDAMRWAAYYELMREQGREALESSEFASSRSAAVA